MRNKIADRIGRTLQPGPLTFADYPLTVIEDDGLLYLGRTALTIISHLPRGPFIRSIAIGCLAEAVMDMPEKYELFAWVLHSTQQPVWSEVQQEVQQLLSTDHIVTKQAAYRLLSFEGSVHAYRLQQTFPPNVFPDNWMKALHDRDPCTSGFSWSRKDCEICVHREDLEPLRIARQFAPHAVAAIVREREDLVAEWVGSVQSEALEAKRRVLLGRSFYETLCEVLLQDAPEKGLVLYQRLQGGPSAKYFVERGTQIPLLTYALFGTLPTSEAMEVWDRQLQQCRTDRELMTIAIAAQAGRGEGWLWSWIERRIHSSVLFEQARAYTLVAFLRTEQASIFLSERLASQPETWIGKVAETGLQRWRANEWARYWYNRFLSTEDDMVAWAAFKLFLQCVDSRFWLWRSQLETEVNLRSTRPKRWIFLENNRDTIENHVRQNEKQLTETFLGQKILRDKVWPWA